VEQREEWEKGWRKRRRKAWREKGERRRQEGRKEKIGDSCGQSESSLLFLLTSVG